MNEVLTHGTTWMNLENTVTSKKPHTKNNVNIVLFHLHEKSRVVQFIETESRL